MHFVGICARSNALIVKTQSTEGRSVLTRWNHCQIVNIIILWRSVQIQLGHIGSQNKTNNPGCQKTWPTTKIAVNANSYYCHYHLLSFDYILLLLSAIKPCLLNCSDNFKSDTCKYDYRSVDLFSYCLPSVLLVFDFVRSNHITDFNKCLSANVFWAPLLRFKNTSGQMRSKRDFH